eukprot:jgi/Chrzof1/5842/Cz16g17250.t1
MFTALLLGMPHLALEILPANFGSFPPISPGCNPSPGHPYPSPSQGVILPPAIRTPSVHTTFSGCASRPSGGMCHTPTPPGHTPTLSVTHIPTHPPKKSE